MATSTYSSRVNRQRRNCIEQAWEYLDRVLAPPEEIKVLLCDDATRGMLNVCYSQHQLLQHNVVLVDMLANTERYPMKHFSCAVLCRPTAESLAALYQELAEGNFATYRIFFTNMMDASTLQSVANADLIQLTERVEEVYVDSIPLTEWVCLTQLRPVPLSAGPVSPLNPITYGQWDPRSLERMADSIVSFLLSTNRRPVLRYRGGSQVAEKMAADVAARMRNVHATFPDLKAQESVLLFVERQDDPLSPLLTPWTYEAMIHELIGFQRGNELVLDDADDDAKPEERIHVMTPNTDAFFAQHRYDDWGQVCIAVSEMVKAYKEMNNYDRNTVSLEEIRTFMNRFPEAKRQSAQVTRHCGITTQLLAEINGRNLTRLSVLEQDMVANNNLAEHSRLVTEVVQDPQTDVDDALRLVMIYSLHYEKNPSNIIPQLKLELEQRQCPAERIALIDRLLGYAGEGKRVHELFKTSTGRMFRAVVRSVGPFGQDVQNVMTQYVPNVKKVINRAYNGRLAEDRYPVQEVVGSPVPTAQVPFVRGKDIIVVFIGGITYSEAMLIAQINRGDVDNNQEALMSLGRNISRGLGGGGGPAAGPSDEPLTAKIEARVTALSTAMLNSKEFIRALSA